jgi:hypothetical protein
MMAKNRENKIMKMVVLILIMKNPTTELPQKNSNRNTLFCLRITIGQRTIPFSSLESTTISGAFASK